MVSCGAGACSPLGQFSCFTADVCLPAEHLLNGCNVVQEPAAPVANVQEEEEEGPMYFQDPRTLLQIYAQLEEQNLFLIQNAQESEEALEELRAKFRSVNAAQSLV